MTLYTKQITEQITTKFGELMCQIINWLQLFTENCKKLLNDAIMLKRKCYINKVEL